MKKLYPWPVLAGFGVLGAGFAVLACTETVRATYESPDGSVGGNVNLPNGDAAYDAALPPADAAALDLSDVPVTCAATPCAAQLERGDEHFCARLADGTVRCWGGDVYGTGTLGSVAPTDAGADAAPWGAAPVRVQGLPGADALSVDEGTGCARSDGGLSCWGDNSVGQLALAKTDPALQDSNPHPTPHAIALPAKVDRFNVGTYGVCAHLEGGAWWCWGGSPGSTFLRGPAYQEGYVPGLAAVPADLGPLFSLKTGVNTGFGVSSAGGLYSWGGGILGRISSLPDDGPDRITGITDEVVSMATNGYQACAIGKSDPNRPPLEAHLWCWGNNEAGQLGNGVQDNRDVPTLVELISKESVAAPQQVSTGYRATCIRTTSGSVYCTGSNLHGRLGLPETTAIEAIFVQIPGVTDAVSVAVGRSTSCALLRTGKVACWGSNELGQLGIGTRDMLAHPTPSMVVFP